MSHVGGEGKTTGFQFQCHQHNHTTYYIDYIYYIYLCKTQLFWYGDGVADSLFFRGISMATSMDVNTETSRNFHGSTKVSNTANSDFRCRQICPVSHLDVRVCDVVKDVSLFPDRFTICTAALRYLQGCLLPGSLWVAPLTGWCNLYKLQSCLTTLSFVCFYYHVKILLMSLSSQVLLLQLRC